MKIEYLFIGLFLIIIGILFIFLSVITTNNEENYNNYNINNNHSNDIKDNKTNFKYSGIIMIGPIPIVFGNSPTLIVISLLITIFMVIWIFLCYISFIKGLK